MSTLKFIRTLAKVATKEAPKRKAVLQDARYALIKKMIYDNPIPAAPVKANSPRDSPVYVGSDSELIDIEELERSYCLHLQLEKEQKLNTLKELYTSMRCANEELKRKDERLFNGAQIKLSEHLQFPKRLRIPTETPPRNGWDYAMNPEK